MREADRRADELRSTEELREIIERTERERQRLEQQLRHVQKLESLGVMAGGIAHDFNNVLAVVLALRSLSPGHPARPLVDEILKAAQRAAELTRQMLAYSGKGHFVLQRIDLSSLVRGMHHMLRVSVSKKACLEEDLAQDLPPVLADATQLRQVLMNLLVNASEALEERAGTIRLSTSAQFFDGTGPRSHLVPEPLPGGRYAALTVCDTGCGMDPVILGRLFDPFFSTKFTGRGLGLAAVLGIVRGHHGAIQVESHSGQGTTFRVLLPADESAPAEDEASSAEGASTWRGAGLILLADDEVSVRAVAREMLERLGFRVLEVADGQAAVDHFARLADEIACVLLDLTMPRLGGLEALAAIRDLRPEVPALLSSGYTEQELGTQRGQLRCVFVQKPYTLELLQAALERALEPDVPTRGRSPGGRS
jgi:two-component system cell cycle sensor histidine kinase/response regulator CckA